MALEFTACTMMLPTDLELAWLVPRICRLAVEIGIRIRSSWSWPVIDCPLALSTPTTANGTFLMRIIWPTGLVSPNRFWATVLPSSATFAPEFTSSVVNAFPWSTVWSRVVR